MYKRINSFIGMGFFAVVFDAGGIWEENGLRGCGHFMEHLMCKTYEYLYPKMRRFNIEDNAVTTDSSVIFYASGLNEYLPEISQKILDELINKKNIWTEEQFNTEKKIILQEYGDAFNDQFTGTYLNIFRKHFNYFTAYGVRDDIEKFTYEKSLEMAKKWFGTPRKIVIVGHDVCYYGGYVHSSYPKNNAFGDYDVPIEKVPKEDKTVVSLVWKRPIPIDQGPKINLLTRCIASGLESPLYQEVREKRGLAYFLDFSSNCIGNDIVLTLFSQTANETTSQTIDTCIDFFEKDVSDIITKDRFEDCKQGLICQKKEGEILSHEGVWYTEMESFNQFDGIDDFTYSQLVDFGNKLFSYRDNYKIIV